MNQVDNTTVETLITEHFGAAIRSVEESYGTLDIVITRDKNIEVIEWLRDHKTLQFNFLTSLCGVHFPAKTGEEIAVVYHLHSFATNIRIRVHTFLPQADPTIFSLTKLYSGATWMERETFEFYGVNFVGHPDLRIILNVEDMPYHPLLKQYPLNDATRTDKEDKYFGR